MRPMQRLIILAAIVLGLLIGGAGLVYMNIRKDKPHPVWVPLPLNPEITEAKQRDLADRIREILDDPELLRTVSRELKLGEAWELANLELCVKELRRRMFVRPGDMSGPMGTVPAIHVGVEGTVREKELTGKIAMRLMKDVWKELGIKPPDAGGR
jgi:hypothetical protein